MTLLQIIIQQGVHSSYIIVILTIKISKIIMKKENNFYQRDFGALTCIKVVILSHRLL